MQALRQGWVSRPVSKGMHAGHKSEIGAVTRFRDMFHKFGKKFGKFRVPTRRRRRRRRLAPSGFDIMAGARFVLQRGGGAVRSGPVAGGAA